MSIVSPVESVSQPVPPPASVTASAVPTPARAEAAREGSVDKSGTRVRRMFGEIAQRYDFMNHLLSGGVDYYWRWRTVRLAAPSGTEPILDVCTGTGDLALAYWKAGRGQVSVIGTDFTREMLVLADRKSVAERQAAEQSGRSLAFLEADTQELPFPDNTYQLVSVAFGLRNVSDTLAGLREMTRVCRVGGRVVVLEFSMPQWPVVGGLYRWYFRNVLPRVGQMLARNQHSAYNYLPSSVAEFPQGQELADLMQQAGLCQVRWIPFTLGIATLYIGVKASPDGQPSSPVS